MPEIQTSRVTVRRGLCRYAIAERPVHVPVRRTKAYRYASMGLYRHNEATFRYGALHRVPLCFVPRPTPAVHSIPSLRKRPLLLRFWQAGLPPSLSAQRQHAGTANAIRSIPVTPVVFHSPADVPPYIAPRLSRDRHPFTESCYMSRPPNHQNPELLATARWLLSFEKLSVRALRRCYRNAATDRIAAVCRLVKAEARQRVQDARALGIVADVAAGATTRPTPPRRRMPSQPTRRARSTPMHPRVQPLGNVQHTLRLDPRAMHQPHGPRGALIAALKDQQLRVQERELHSIAATITALDERLEGLARQVANFVSARTVAPLPPSVTPRTTRARIISGMRQCAAHLGGLLRTLIRRGV